VTRAAILVLVALASASCSKRTDWVIRIEGMKFQPEVLTIARGDQVTWHNTDMVPHTAVATGRFNSGPIASEGDFRVTLVQVGELGYVCTLHPGMAGKIIVKPE
jgi:plastocyanin